MPAHSRSKNGVASLAYVAGIHVLAAERKTKTWTAGTSPAMTTDGASCQGRPLPVRASCDKPAPRGAAASRLA